MLNDFSPVADFTVNHGDLAVNHLDDRRDYDQRVVDHPDHEPDELEPDLDRHLEYQHLQQHRFEQQHVE